MAKPGSRGRIAPLATLRQPALLLSVLLGLSRAATKFDFDCIHKKWTKVNLWIQDSETLTYYVAGACPRAHKDNDGGVAVYDVGANLGFTLPRYSFLWGQVDFDLVKHYLREGAGGERTTKGGLRTYPVFQKQHIRGLEIHAFEPMPHIQKFASKYHPPMLKRALKFHNLGVGGEVGNFCFTNSTTEGATLTPCDQRADLVHVSVTTLDHFTEEAKIKKVLYLKIDAEGHDGEVIYGARKLLEEKKVHALEFEHSRVTWKDATRGLKATVQLLDDLGYKCYHQTDFGRDAMSYLIPISPPHWRDEYHTQNDGSNVFCIDNALQCGQAIPDVFYPPECAIKE
eukprot:m.58379 g.58379  ORF g.58379 m.58379 type:complete len:341 (-) comp9407_c0_seq2:173-1195(-)